MNDLISRQQAIDAVIDELDMIDHVPQWVFDRLEKRLKQLPPTQPEIIRCKDCKYYDPIYANNEGVCGHWNAKTENNAYCSYAERRTDERFD